MLFIFDWDGTISDSTQKIIGCMHQASDSEGLPRLADGDVREIIGLGLPEAIATLYPELDQRGVVSMRDAYARHFIEADAEPSGFFPNVEDTLESLLSRGHHIAVATGKSRAGLNRVLASLKWDDYFHASRCADETASKPHPRMLHELLGHFDMSAERAVMVGDTEYDMEMAARAEMPRVAVDYGAHHVDRLKGYDHLMCISDFSELLDLS